MTKVRGRSDNSPGASDLSLINGETIPRSPIIEHTEPPTISIVIPTYQAGETLARALDSILAQTFCDVEVLVMDGESPDRTASIATEYGKRHPQIRFFSEPDAGVYDAMNKGIRLARGQWLLFLGSDDVLYTPDTLRKVVASFGDDVDVVYGNVFSSRFGGIYDGEFDNQKIIDKNISHQSIFFHRRVFEWLGEYDPDYRVVADWEFNFRWFLSSRIRKQHINEVVANYADGGMSSRNDDPLFQQNRMLLYLRYGHEQLGRGEKNRILWSEFKRAVRRRNIRLLCGVLGAFVRYR